jgi:hypothetical protein
MRKSQLLLEPVGRVLFGPPNGGPFNDYQNVLPNEHGFIYPVYAI